jgi:hypothetical protein
MLGVRATGAALMSVLLLTACSGGDDEPKAKPSATSTSASPSATPTSSSTPSTSSDAPASCAELSLDAGADVQGRALATCLGDALEQAGSGVEQVVGEDLSATIRFTWADDVSYAGEVQSSDGPVGLVVVPPTTWVDLGDAWAKSDPDGDENEVLAADIGGLVAPVADPGTVVDLVGGSKRWTVGARTEKVDQPDGTTVTAWPLESAPFTADDTQVKDAVLWLDKDTLAPAGMKATVTADGTTTTITRYFSQLGEPQKITPPQ